MCTDAGVDVSTMTSTHKYTHARTAHTQPKEDHVLHIPYIQTQHTHTLYTHTPTQSPIYIHSHTGARTHTLSKRRCPPLPISQPWAAPQPHQFPPHIPLWFPAYLFYSTVLSDGSRSRHRTASPGTLCLTLRGVSSPKKDEFCDEMAHRSFLMEQKLDFTHRDPIPPKPRPSGRWGDGERGREGERGGERERERGRGRGGEREGGREIGRAHV